MNSFIQFLKGKEIRGHLVTAGIGFAIVLIGTFAIESKNVSFFINLFGAVAMITAVHEIMNKVPK